MFQIIAVIIIAALVLTGHRLGKLKSEKKALQTVRDKWGKLKTEGANHDLLMAYHEALTGSDTGSLTDDLNFNTLFGYIDRTNSGPGQQYLYHQLLTQKPEPEALEQQENLVQQIAVNEHLRERLELQLFKLNNANASYLHQLFTRKNEALYDKAVGLYIQFAGALWIGVFGAMLIAHNQTLFLLFVALTLINSWLHYSNKRKIVSYIHSLPQLKTLINVAGKVVSEVSYGTNAAIKESLVRLAKLERRLGLLTLQNASDPTDISYAVTELVKMVLLMEPRAFINSIGQINERREEIRAIFNFVGAVDTAISIVSLRIGLPWYTMPVFNNADELHVEALYHPLVAHCVPNSLDCNTQRGTLITGSNMSGKTTFIKALAVNVLLAQTLNTSCSRHYAAPVMNVYTSIRIGDDIGQQQSYFQAEALSIQQIFNNAAASFSKNLIIIDEIFKGTNTIERVAAAKAVLSYLLTGQNFVFVSTHDIELAELLGSDYVPYSFEENALITGEMSFDYKIKPGILKNKNAINILTYLGYPEQVIREAAEVSKQLTEKYRQ